MTPPKYLRDIAAGLSEQATLPPGVRLYDVNISLHAVLEPLRDALPRRYAFPGVAKVFFSLGAPPADGIRLIALGVAMYNWYTFDAERYLTLDRAQQQYLLLDGIQTGLQVVAAAIGADTKPIHHAVHAVRSREFPLPDFTLKELQQRWGLAKQDDA